MEDNNIMSWDDTIETDGQEYILLPEGDYPFTVTAFERASFPGSEKIPACNKATLTLTVEYAGKSVNIKTDLILYRTLEWKIASFFRCIGLKKHGEKLQMNWNKVTGATGTAHFKPRKGTNGNLYNDVERFLDPEALVEVDSAETPWGGF